MINRLKAIFKSFQEHNVNYLVIGGIAAILYGVPRATFDLDILIEKSEENVGRLLEALIAAGITSAELTDVDGILHHEISIFKDQVRIDVQTQTPGLVFEDAWKRRTIMQYRGQEFYVVSKDDLIASKKASARPVDL